MTNHLWQSTLFAAAVGLLTFAFRKNRAKVRFWLWFSASAKFLVPFALLIGVGNQLQWMPPTTPAVTFTVVEFAQPFPGRAPFAPSSADWRPLGLAAVWACGFACVAIIRLRSWSRIRAAVRSSLPLELPLAVEVRSSPGLLEPGVVGLFRPTLLLPAGIADRLTPPQLEAVLAHELCHVRRRDNLFAAIHMMVEAAFWFHPLVWWIGARMLEERERACDEEVLRLGSEPHIYAEGILNVCKLYVESPLVCVSGVTGSDLKMRIEAIMTNRIGNGLNFAKKLVLAVAGMAAFAAPVIVGMMHTPAIRAESPKPAAEAPAAPAPQVVPAQAAPPQGATLVTPGGESQRRTAYAKEHFGTGPMARTYERYGPPDQIDDRSSDPQNPSLVWRYNYLENFHSNVEFEFMSGKGPLGFRINWPEPATVQSYPGVAPALVDALNREIQSRGGTPAVNVMAGLPGGHASFQLYPAGELQTLVVPLDSLSGRVDLMGEIRTRLNTGASGSPVANVRDFIQAAAGTFQAKFILMAGSYVCHLVVREQATGQMYGETIDFEVK